MARSTSGESLLTRVVRILDSFTAASPALSTSDIARRANLPSATAYRLVNELVDLGVLERDVDNRVRVGVLTWEWSFRSSYPHRLRQIAMPVMERLQAAVQHHTMLGVLVGSEILYLERISAPDAVENIAQAGGRLPIHAVSAGLILLAYAPRDLQEQVLGTTLRAYTTATITRTGTLRRVLADVRITGLAVGDETVLPGVVGLAAPVWNGAREPAAALSIVFPRDDPRRRAHVEALRAAAREISHELAVTRSIGAVD